MTTSAPNRTKKTSVRTTVITLSVDLSEGRPIKQTQPYPGLLVGARDKNGFDTYASSAPGHNLPASSTAMIGSQAKTFTATAILQLDQEGELSIKDTLADPRWSDVLDWPNANNITIEMVLSHTAGIPEFTATKQVQKNVGDPDWNSTPEDLLGLVRGELASYPPGKGWEYSNTDYIILGLIIEKVTGNSYASELDSRFLRPLGLPDTYLYGDPKRDPSMTGFYLWCRGASMSDAGFAGAGIASSSGTGGGAPKCPSRVGEWLPVSEPYTNSWPIIWAAGGKGYGLGMGYFKYDIGKAYGHPGNIMALPPTPSTSRPGATNSR